MTVNAPSPTLRAGALQLNDYERNFAVFQTRAFQLNDYERIFYLLES
jgi:hypothetical protein